MDWIKRNILIAYVLSACKNSWFFLGIWVFYYLRFTNYSGIGLLETVMIVSMVVFEIPTGAIADLFGKKRTLIMAMTTLGLGTVWMAYAPSYFVLALTIAITSLGAALYSGTLDALVYDTLKTNQMQDKYPRVLANINTIALFSPAICGLLGGYLYVVNYHLPLFLGGIILLLGAVMALFLVEPKIDTIKFNWINYRAQLRLGFMELFKTSSVIKQTVTLLIIGSVVVIFDEMLNAFVAMDFGFKETEMGLLFAGLYLISALATQSVPYLNKHLGVIKSVVVVGAIMALTMLVSPWLGLLVGGLSIFIRVSGMSIYNSLAVVLINQNTQPQVRATTLSSFNTVKNIPYIVVALLAGAVTDMLTARWTVFLMGVVLIGSIGLQVYFFKVRTRRLALSQQK